jgi:hypothetical protein
MTLPGSAPRSPAHATLATLLLAVAIATGSATAAGAIDAPVALGRLPQLAVWLLDGSAVTGSAVDGGAVTGGAVDDGAVDDGGSVAATVLALDGSLWWVAGGAPLRLAAGLGGEQAVACGGSVLAVDVLGRLRRFAFSPDLPVVTSSGPQVSLLHRPLCLDALAADPALDLGTIVVVAPDGDVLLLGRDLRVRERAAGVRALPDAELVLIELADGLGPAVAVLADPTQRYRNGVLGDEVEAGSVVVLALPSLREVTRWVVAPPAVIEERRPTPWRSEEAAGLHLTVSDEESGARLVTLTWDGASLVVAAVGPDMGGPSLWLHVLAAIESRAYVQHRPHVGGPLVRYEFVARLPPSSERLGALPRTPALVESRLEVASHVVGERNLDRGVWLREAAAGVDLLALPHADARSVAWLRCDAAACRVAHWTPLAARLITNLAPVGPPGSVTGVLAGDEAGTVWWLPVPQALGR